MVQTTDITDVIFASVRAVRTLNGVTYSAPVLTSFQLEALADAQVFLQCENFQRGGTFKFRGAYHDAIARLMSSPPSRVFATVSSRNHVGKDLRWPVVFREPPRMS